MTVLNGHIHQIMQKVEGNMSFHTAMSTAFPQPTPGTAPAPGPMKVEPERLKSVLGITDVTFIPGRSTLAVVDATLSGEPPAFEAASHDAMMQRKASARRRSSLGPNEIGIDNFSFTPPVLDREGGHDGHVDQQRRRAAPDRERRRTSSSSRRCSIPISGSARRSTKPGTYDYFCSLHPKMQGRVVVS